MSDEEEIEGERLFEQYEAELDRLQGGEAGRLIDEAIAHLQRAKLMPLSSSCMVNRDEMLEILHAAKSEIPEEIKQARWLIKEQQDHIEQARREAEAIIDEARSQAERMVEKTEIVRHAREFANQLIKEAKEATNKMRRDTEDYCDRKLALFEIAIQDVLKMVAQARNKLSVRPIDSGLRNAPESPQEEAIEKSEFFDQDSL